jgi:hypothetical protein
MLFCSPLRKASAGHVLWPSTAKAMVVSNRTIYLSAAPEVACKCLDLLMLESTLAAKTKSGYPTAQCQKLPHLDLPPTLCQSANIS